MRNDASTYNSKESGGRREKKQYLFTNTYILYIYRVLCDTKCFFLIIIIIITIFVFLVYSTDATLEKHTM